MSGSPLRQKELRHHPSKSYVRGFLILLRSIQNQKDFSLPRQPASLPPWLQYVQSCGLQPLGWSQLHRFPSVWSEESLEIMPYSHHQPSNVLNSAIEQVHDDLRSARRRLHEHRQAVTQARTRRQPVHALNIVAVSLDQEVTRLRNNLRVLEREYPSFKWSGFLADLC